MALSVRVQILLGTEIALVFAAANLRSSLESVELIVGGTYTGGGTYAGGGACTCTGSTVVYPISSGSNGVRKDQRPSVLSFVKVRTAVQMIL